MVRDLLIGGMIAGVLAAILSTLFARALAEPQADLAIAYEASHSALERHVMPGMALAITVARPCRNLTGFFLGHCWLRSRPGCGDASTILGEAPWPPD